MKEPNDIKLANIASVIEELEKIADTLTVFAWKDHGSDGKTIELIGDGVAVTIFDGVWRMYTNGIRAIVTINDVQYTAQWYDPNNEWAEIPNIFYPILERVWSLVGIVIPTKSSRIPMRFEDFIFKLAGKSLDEAYRLQIEEPAYCEEQYAMYLKDFCR